MKKWLGRTGIALLVLVLAIFIALATWEPFWAKRDALALAVLLLLHQPFVQLGAAFEFDVLGDLPRCCNATLTAQNEGTQNMKFQQNVATITKLEPRCRMH